jgi:hypothetical protein
MASGKHVDKHSLASAVGPDDGNVFSLEKLKAYRRGQPPFRQARNTIVYGYEVLKVSYPVLH